MMNPITDSITVNYIHLLRKDEYFVAVRGGQLLFTNMGNVYRVNKLPFRGVLESYQTEPNYAVSSICINSIPEEFGLNDAVRLIEFDREHFYLYSDLLEKYKDLMAEYSRMKKIILSLLFVLTFVLIFESLALAYHLK